VNHALFSNKAAIGRFCAGDDDSGNFALCWFKRDTQDPS
jgi:hypothetical protein